MERKSVGTFIAALRRTNGMTQKELAEKLGVSDKTVSHWEREESAPDLTLIPVLAEIFNVTCEEILRGERSNAAGGEPSEAMGKRAEKQLLQMLCQARTKLQTRGMLAAGLSMLGLLSAMIFNFGFLRAYLGFFTACVFYTASFVCETVFLILALASIGGDEFECDERSRMKADMFREAVRVLSLIVILFGVTLPLVMIVRDAYQGALAGLWFLAGLLGALVSLLLCHAASLFIMDAAIRRGVFRLDEKEDMVRRYNNGLKARIAGVTAVILAVTFLGQAAFNRLSVTDFTEGTMFQNFEDFKAYIETPKENLNSGTPERLASANCETVYFDAEGRQIDREEALREYFLDVDGNELYVWRHYNQEVVSIRWGEGEGYLPITVYTSLDLDRGSRTQNAWNIFWAIFYPVEMGAGCLLYMKRRRIV